MKLLDRNLEEETHIDMTSLIDVVFLLVIFFMITTTFIEESNVHKLTLPVSSNPQVITRENALIVSLSKTNQVSLLNGSELSNFSGMNELVTSLKPQYQGAEKPPLILRCDAECDVQQYVHVKNALRLAGVTSFFEEVERNTP